MQNCHLNTFTFESVAVYRKNVLNQTASFAACAPAWRGKHRGCKQVNMGVKRRLCWEWNDAHYIFIFTARKPTLGICYDSAGMTVFLFGLVTRLEVKYKR